MKIVYKARDITEAHIVCGLLNANDITAHVGGHYLQGGVGELMAFDFANVLVTDEDFPKAKQIVSEYEAGDSHSTRYSVNETPREGLWPSSPLMRILLIVILVILISVLLS